MSFFVQTFRPTSAIIKTFLGCMWKFSNSCPSRPILPKPHLKNYQEGACDSSLSSVMYVASKGVDGVQVPEVVVRRLPAENWLQSILFLKSKETCLEVAILTVKRYRFLDVAPFWKICQVNSLEIDLLTTQTAFPVKCAGL